MLILYLTIFIIILFLILVITRDILAAPVMTIVFWILSFMALGISAYSDYVEKLSFFYCMLGVAAFSIGFMILCYRKENSSRFAMEGGKYTLNYRIIKIIFVVELIFVAYVGVIFFKSLTSISNTLNVFTELKSESSESRIILPTWAQYFRNILIAYSIASIVLLSGKGSPRSQDWLLCIAQFCIGLVLSLSLLNRNGVLMFLVPSVAAVLINRKVRSRRIILAGSLMAIGFLFFFLVLAYYKYRHLYPNGFSLSQLVEDQLIGYLIAPGLCFQIYIDNPTDFLYGGNTFRFFCAVLSSMGFDIQTVDLVQDFVSIPNGQMANVYTILQYYYADFGLAYALTIMLLLGCLSGFLYSRMVRGGSLWVFLYAVLLYPAAMQFFQDQYISLLSNWLQYLLVGLLVFKTRFLFAKDTSRHISSQSGKRYGFQLENEV